MFIISPSTKLDFKLTFNQDFDTIIGGYTNSFISEYGIEIFNKADKIVIVEEKFYNIIKNKFGPQLVGEFLEDGVIEDLFNQYQTMTS